MIKRTLLILLSFTILGLEASNYEEKSYGCDGLNPVLGKSTVFIQHEGKNRSYRLYVPKNYEPDHQLL